MESKVHQSVARAFRLTVIVYSDRISQVCKPQPGHNQMNLQSSATLAALIKSEPLWYKNDGPINGPYLESNEWPRWGENSFLSQFAVVLWVRDKLSENSQEGMEVLSLFCPSASGSLGTMASGHRATR